MQRAVIHLSLLVSISPNSNPDPLELELETLVEKEDEGLLTRVMPSPKRYPMVNLDNGVVSIDCIFSKIALRRKRKTGDCAYREAKAKGEAPQASKASRSHCAFTRSLPLEDWSTMAYT